MLQNYIIITYYCTGHKNHYNIEFYTETLESVDRLNNSGEKDNETILAINKLLEEEKNKDRISKHLYMHVKGKMIDSKLNFGFTQVFRSSDSDSSGEHF